MSLMSQQLIPIYTPTLVNPVDPKTMLNNIQKVLQNINILPFDHFMSS